MPRYDFTQRALADLRDIARYTGKTWGLKQARVCREELELGFRKLALAPGMGRVRTEVAPRVRSFPVARHVAFYSESGGGITVLRVLQPNMEVARAFEDGSS